MVEDAEAQHEAAAHAPRGDEHVTLLLDLIGDPRVDPLEPRLVVDARGTAPERDDPERRRRHELEVGRCSDLALRMSGQVEAAIDRVAEGGDAEVAQRDPELQGAAASRQLQPEIREVHLLVGRLDVAEVVGIDLEATAQRRTAAHEQRAELDRLVQPLVRVERDRIRQLDAGKRVPAALGEARERTVRAVDV